MCGSTFRVRQVGFTHAWGLHSLSACICSVAYCSISVCAGNVWYIVGGCSGGGVILMLFMVVVLVVCCWKRRRQPHSTSETERLIQDERECLSELFGVCTPGGLITIFASLVC